MNVRWPWQVELRSMFLTGPDIFIAMEGYFLATVIAVLSTPARRALFSAAAQALSCSRGWQTLFATKTTSMRLSRELRRIMTVGPKPVLLPRASMDKAALFWIHWPAEE